MTEQLVYLNGDFVPESKAKVSVFDRGFTLADGVFETMVAKDGKIFRLKRHLERLDYGCDVLGIPCLIREDIETAIYELMCKNKLHNAVVRLTVTRGFDRERGLNIHNPVFPTVSIRTANRTEHKAQPLSLGIASIVRNEGSPISGIKSLSYVDSVVAKNLALKSGFDDALILNNAGNVTCATSSNFFLTLEDTIFTPPVHDGILAGVTRGFVIEISSSLGLKIKETSIKPRFDKYQESFVTNVVTGVLPVVAINRVNIGSGEVGPITTAITKMLDLER